MINMASIGMAWIVFYFMVKVPILPSYREMRYGVVIMLLILTVVMATLRIAKKFLAGTRIAIFSGVLTILIFGWWLTSAPVSELVQEPILLVLAIIATLVGIFYG